MIGERCPIVELRRYALRPGTRETLIELFDREFVETQEAVEMRVLGQFRDLDDPDSFVWLRGFTDMESRRHGLETFYTGPIWREHRAVAVGTMLDSDNVLLLRAVRGLPHRADSRPPPGRTGSQPGIFVVTTFRLKRATAPAFPFVFSRKLEPALREAGIPVLGTYATKHCANTYPALPVREDAEVFVWMAIFADESEYAHRVHRLERSRKWNVRMSDAERLYFDGPTEVLRLQPTARSAIHV